LRVCAASSVLHRKLKPKCICRTQLDQLKKIRIKSVSDLALVVVAVECSVGDITSSLDITSVLLDVVTSGVSLTSTGTGSTSLLRYTTTLFSGFFPR